MNVASQVGKYVNATEDLRRKGEKKRRGAGGADLEEFMHLEKLKQQEEEFRRLVKLPSIHQEVRQLGIGIDKNKSSSNVYLNLFSALLTADCDKFNFSAAFVIVFSLYIDVKTNKRFKSILDKFII